MSKKLRVFFLSALVVMLAVSSAFAATLQEITITSGDTTYSPTYYTYDSSELKISKDAIYKFDNSWGTVSIDLLSFDQVSEVTLRLPAPVPDQPGAGTQGKWSIHLPTSDNEGNALTSSNRATIKIEKAGTNSAIQVSEEFSLDVTTGINLTLDAPFRVNTNAPFDSLDVSIDVRSGSTLTFGSWAEIFTNSNDITLPTGYLAGNSAKYAVHSDGELIIQNQHAIRGSALSADVKSGGTLTIDIPGAPTIDLRGDLTRTTKESTGATLIVDGTIKIPQNLTLVGEIHVSDASGDITKDGNGTLTLSQLSNWPAPALSKDIAGIYVKTGALVLNGKPSWVTSEDVLVTVGSGATFTANETSINEAGDAVRFSVAGTANFKKHAIYKGNSEIYPYDDYITKNNGIRIDTTGVSIDVTGTVNLDDGSFALETLYGNGTVNITNSNAVQDKTVLIFTSPDVVDGYTKFVGKIQGTHANVGLYAPDRTKRLSFDSQLLEKADVSIDNLIVYGPAILAISNDTNLGKVKNIYLRGHRPGANNFTDTGINYKVANVKLTVGGLEFMPGTDERADISGLKIDATSSTEDMACIKLGQSADVKIDTIELYANRGVIDGVSRDFPVDVNYVIPGNGIYALKIDGSEQPSRLTIDGTTVTGDGLAADVANTERMYQVQITDSSDVKFIGSGRYYPIAHNNSLYVGKDVKLEMSRGAVIDGHLAFAGSTVADLPVYSNDTGYPADDWFASGDNKWNIEEYLLSSADLRGFSTFTTQVGASNRRTNEGGEYAVLVSGDLTLSFDQTKADTSTPYPGNILVRTKTDIDAFAGFLEDTTRFTTIGERFKVLGSVNGKYTPDFVTTYNDMFQFRIPADSADKRGVTVEVRTELAILELGEWSFLRGGDEFRQGTGHNFEIKIPLTAVIRGEAATISRDVISSVTHYYLGLGGNKYYIEEPRAYFRKYADGAETAIDNVLDTDKWVADTLVSKDVTFRAEFEYFDENGNPNPYIRLIGTGYYGTDPIDIGLSVRMVHEPDGNPPTTTMTYLDGVVPAFREFRITREGTADDDAGIQWSKSTAEPSGKTTFTVGDPETVTFKVSDFRQATYATTTAANAYDVTAKSGSYFMLNSNGQSTRVTNLILKLFNGYYLNRTTTSSDIEDSFDITIDGSTATVTVPLEALGTTGTRLFAEKGLALAGTTDAGGQIVTVPVAYSLRAPVSTDDTIVAERLSTTVTIGDAPVTDKYIDINPDDLSGDIHFIHNFENWISFTGSGETISYTIPDTSKAQPGVYNFTVLAYTGDNDTTSSHKLYTFTVTVVEPEAPGIYGAETMNVIIGETATLTLRAVASGDATVTWAIADNTNPEGLLTGSANGLVYTLTANAADVYVAEGSYVYTITAGGFSKTVTVNVSEPEFTITAESNTFEDGPVADHMYTAVFSASGAQGEEVVWRLTDNTKSSLYSFHSGDLFVVEGVAKVARDADDNDEDQTFRVVATAGNRTVEEPIETTFTVEADETTYTALAPAAGSHTAVDASYVVNFPANVTAEVDTVFLPSWLEPVLNDDGSVIGIKFSKVAGELANGTQATVRIEATDNSEDLADDDDGSRYYGWEVVYNAEPEKLTLTLTPAALTVAVDAEATSKASVTNALGNVRYTLSKDAALTWVTISGDVVTVSKPTTAGSYTVTVVAQDDRGAASQATQVLTITVTDGPTPPTGFSISVSQNSVTFDSPTASAKTVTLSATGASGSVTYTTAVSPTTGLTATVSGDVLTLTPSAAGTYTVTVTGTNGTNTATATVNVTVNSGTGPTPEDFSISVSRSSVTFDSPTASAQTVTLSTNFLGATVTYSAAVSPATGLTASVSGTTLTLTPSAAGTYVVTVTGTNGTRTATATVNVTVSSGSTPTTFSISASPATVTFTSVSAAAQTVTLSATNASGSVNYTAEVTASSTGSTGLTDGLDLTVSGNTLTIDPLEAGTYTVTITGNTTTQTATTTITVVVTSAVARVGSSGGGCDAGFGALALVLAAPLFLRRRRS